MSGQAFIVSFYAEGARRASDGVGPFATRSDAIAYGRGEVARVAAMAPEERDATLDWARRFTVRRTSWPD